MDTIPKKMDTTNVNDVANVLIKTFEHKSKDVLQTWKSLTMIWDKLTEEQQKEIARIYYITKFDQSFIKLYHERNDNLKKGIEEWERELENKEELNFDMLDIMKLKKKIEEFEPQLQNVKNSLKIYCEAVSVSSKDAIEEMLNSLIYELEGI